MLFSDTMGFLTKKMEKFLVGDKVESNENMLKKDETVLYSNKIKFKNDKRVSKRNEVLRGDFRTSFAPTSFKPGNIIITNERIIIAKRGIDLNNLKNKDGYIQIALNTDALNKNIEDISSYNKKMTDWIKEDYPKLYIKGSANLFASALLKKDVATFDKSKKKGLIRHKLLLTYQVLDNLQIFDAKNHIKDMEKLEKELESDNSKKAEEYKNLIRKKKGKFERKAENLSKLSQVRMGPYTSKILIKGLHKKDFIQILDLLSKINPSSMEKYLKNKEEIEKVYIRSNEQENKDKKSELRE